MRSLNLERIAIVKPIINLLFLSVLIALASSSLLAADRGTLVREAILYLSPDTNSNKLAQIERGRELVLLEKSPQWLHVEAMLGSSPRDAAFINEDKDKG